MNMVAHATSTWSPSSPSPSTGASSSTDAAGARRVWRAPYGGAVSTPGSSRMDQVFKAYDVRGTVPDQLDADMCRAIGRAMARFVGRPSILVARDMRERAWSWRPPSPTACGPRVSTSSTSAWPPPTSSTSRRAISTRRRHVHRVAQPGAVQRAEALPVRAPAPSGVTPAWPTSRPAPGSCSANPCRPSRGVGASRTCSTSGPTTSCPSSTSGRCARSRSWPTPPTAWAAWSCRSCSSGLPFTVDILFPELDGNFPNHPADPIQPENLVALKAAVLEHERRHRAGLRRGRRPCLPGRREGRARLGLADHGAGGRFDAGQTPGRDDPLQPDLLPRGARGRDRAGGPAHPHPGRPLHHQEGDGRDRGRLRRGALGPLLLPRQLPGRLGHHHRPPGPGAALPERAAALGDAAARTSATSTRERSTPTVASPAATVAAIAEHERKAGAVGRHAGRAHRRAWRLVVQRPPLQHRAVAPPQRGGEDGRSAAPPTWPRCSN